MKFDNNENTSEIKINVPHDSIYKLKFKFWLKTSLSCLIIFCIAIALNFPLKTLIITNVENILRNQTTCPIQFDEIKFSWFMPKIIFVHPEIKSACFGQGREDLSLTKLNIAILRPTFFPPGIQLESEIAVGPSKLDITYIVSLSGQFIAVQNGIIQGDLISKISGKDILTGNIMLEARADIGSKTLRELVLHIKSTNLYILGLNTPLIKTPALDIGNLSLKGKLEDGKDFIVDELILGKKNSPIKTDFKGIIELNTYNMMFSTYNLRGEMRIENELLGRSDMVLLKMMLEKHAHEDGSYQLELKGPFNGLPQANFL